MKLRLVEVIEVRMLKSHAARDALVGLEGNHLGKQVDSVLVHVLYMLSHWNAPPLGELRLEVLVLQSFWPVLGVRRSLDLEDFEYLIDFAVSNEQGLALSHLSKDATYAPDVNWG